MEKRFLELSSRLQTRDINGVSQKKKQDIFCSCMWAWNFRVQRYIIGIHNAMAQIGLETNS